LFYKKLTTPTNADNPRDAIYYIQWTFQFTSFAITEKLIACQALLQPV